MVRVRLTRLPVDARRAVNQRSARDEGREDVHFDRGDGAFVGTQQRSINIIEIPFAFSCHRTNFLVAGTARFA